jgi:hypothetical protein
LDLNTLLTKDLVDEVMKKDPTDMPDILQPMRAKRRRYIGDFSLSDMEDAELSKLYYSRSKEYVQSLQEKIKGLERTIKILRRKERSQLIIE